MRRLGCVAPEFLHYRSLTSSAAGGDKGLQHRAWRLGRELGKLGRRRSLEVRLAIDWLDRRGLILTSSMTAGKRSESLVDQGSIGLRANLPGYKYDIVPSSTRSDCEILNARIVGQTPGQHIRSWLAREAFQTVGEDECASIGSC